MSTAKPDLLFCKGPRKSFGFWFSVYSRLPVLEVNELFMLLYGLARVMFGDSQIVLDALSVKRVYIYMYYILLNKDPRVQGCKIDLYMYLEMKSRGLVNCEQSKSLQEKMLIY